MVAVQAARAGMLIGAESVVPIHYGTFPILAGTPSELAEACAGAFEVVPLDVGVPAT
jgi:L-ascorbate metabolism protein UlaG (beta-lactamase superfamily)